MKKVGDLIGRLGEFIDHLSIDGDIQKTKQESEKVAKSNERLILTDLMKLTTNPLKIFGK